MKKRGQLGSTIKNIIIPLIILIFIIITFFPKIMLGATNFLAILGIEVGDVIDSFSVEPTTFSEETIMTYRLKRTANINISILDTAHKEIHSFKAKNQTKGAHRITWNGKDKDGNQAPDGEYTLILKSENENREVRIEKKTAEIIQLSNLYHSEKNNAFIRIGCFKDYDKIYINIYDEELHLIQELDSDKERFYNKRKVNGEDYVVDYSFEFGKKLFPGRDPIILSPGEYYVEIIIGSFISEKIKIIRIE